MTTALETTPLPGDVAQQIRRTVADINMLPAIAVQALDIAKDPDCSIGQFSTVVERDVKLAADILALANSAMYSPGAPIVSLHQAVVRLGFRQCKNLIFSSSVTAMMNKISLEEEWIRELLWRHAFQTAMLGLHLNRTLNLGFQGEEFTAGLIHDFGRTLLAVSLPGRFADVDSLEFQESAATLEHERRVLSTDHCEVGAWFAAANQLPEALVEVVRRHHEPRLAGRHIRLCALTAAADHMANHLQRCEGPEGYVPDDNAGVQILEACGVRHVVSRFNEIHATVMEAAARDAVEMMAC